MIERIALTGSMYSGKSTIAEALGREGYMRIVFTDLLKELTANALSFIGVRTSVEEMNTNKRKYRPLLQEMGAITGFDTDPYYVRRALFPWFDAPDHRVVFDNVRTPQQFDALYRYDFKLVEVKAPLTVLDARAAAVGVSLEELLAVRAHPIEQGTGLTPDFVLDGTKDPQTNVRFLMGEKELTTKVV